MLQFVFFLGATVKIHLKTIPRAFVIRYVKDAKVKSNTRRSDNCNLFNMIFSGILLRLLGKLILKVECYLMMSDLSKVLTLMIGLVSCWTKALKASYLMTIDDGTTSDKVLVFG